MSKVLTITTYDSITGRITGFIEGFPELSEFTIESLEEDYIKGKYLSETYYVNDGVAKFRPQNPTTLNGLVLSDVPPNSEITIENETYPCPDGGDVTLNFQHPGTYIVTVSCFPYLDKEFEIDYQP